MATDKEENYGNRTETQTEVTMTETAETSHEQRMKEKIKARLAAREIEEKKIAERLGERVARKKSEEQSLRKEKKEKKEKAQQRESQSQPTQQQKVGKQIEKTAKEKQEKRKEKKRKEIALPTLEQTDTERKRLKRGKQYRKSLRGTVNVLIVVAAIAVLVATLMLPILQVSGISMEPTLEEDDIVVLVKTGNFKPGDMIGFYYQGKILLKRVVAVPGDNVVIDDEGFVYVNGELLLDDAYIKERSLGECDLEFPYTVPEQAYFVLGDNRVSAVDSRSSMIGAVSKEDIIGKVFLKVWPLNELGIY